LAWFKEGVLDYVYIIDINETCIRRQKMKLYTEADLKKIISIYSEEYKTSTDEILKELNLTPIELPSDEDVAKMRKAYIEHVNTIVHKDLERDGYLDIGFLKGAKCVIDKIQGRQ
jgi:hypothetical protein